MVKTYVFLDEQPEHPRVQRFTSGISRDEKARLRKLLRTGNTAAFQMEAECLVRANQRGVPLNPPLMVRDSGLLGPRK